MEICIFYAKMFYIFVYSWFCITKSYGTQSIQKGYHIIYDSKKEVWNVEKLKDHIHFDCYSSDATERKDNC